MNEQSEKKTKKKSAKPKASPSPVRKTKKKTDTEIKQTKSDVAPAITPARPKRTRKAAGAKSGLKAEYTEHGESAVLPESALEKQGGETHEEVSSSKPEQVTVTDSGQREGMEYAFLTYDLPSRSVHSSDMNVPVPEKETVGQKEDKAEKAGFDQSGSKEEAVVVPELPAKGSPALLLKDPAGYIRLNTAAPSGSVLKAFFLLALKWGSLSLLGVRWFAGLINSSAFSFSRLNFTDSTRLWLRVVIIGLIFENILALGISLIRKLSLNKQSYTAVISAMAVTSLPIAVLYLVAVILQSVLPLAGVAAAACTVILSVVLTFHVFKYLLFDDEKSTYIYYSSLLYGIGVLVSLILFRMLCPDIIRILQSIINL